MIFIYTFILFLFPSIKTFAYDLGAPKQAPSSKIKELKIDDVRPPIMVNNNIINYSTVQVF